MGRKRTTGAEGMNGVHDAGTAVLDPPAEGEEKENVAQTTPKTRPVASFASHSDRTTRLEVAIWARVVKVSDTEEYTQYSLTMNRSWRNEDNVWTKNDFWRSHDVPVLLYLIQQAYNWCQCQRVQVSVASDEDMPF